MWAGAKARGCGLPLRLRRLRRAAARIQHSWAPKQLVPSLTGAQTALVVHATVRIQSGPCKWRMHNKCRLNPFPMLVTSDVTRVCGPSIIAPRAAADRPSGTVDRVWVPTKYTKPLSPTARRRTRPLPPRRAEWPPRRPSETSRHRTVKSRLRDGYACYRSRHGARGSRVGGGSGTEAEIAPIRHFSCLDFASACPRDGPQNGPAVRIHGIGSGRPHVEIG